MVQSTPQLKPLKIGQLLDRTMHIYRTNFWTMLAIVACVQIPIGLGALVSSWVGGQNLAAVLADPLAPASSAQTMANTLNVLITVVGAFFLQFAQAALMFVTSRVLFGQSSTVRESYAFIRTRWQALVGNYFLLAIAGFLAAIWWIVVPCLGWLTGLGLILFIVFVVSPLSIVVVTLEGQSPWQAIPRAWHLARFRFWPAFWASISVTLLGQAIAIGPQLLISSAFAALLIESTTSGSTENLALTLAVTTVGSTLIALFVVPISAIAMTLLYFDLRLRTEGLDLALQTLPSAIEPEEKMAQPHTLLVQAPRAVAAGGLEISSEFGRFFAITAGAIGLIIGLYALLVGTIFIIIFLVS